MVEVAGRVRNSAMAKVQGQRSMLHCDLEIELVEN